MKKIIKNSFVLLLSGLFGQELFAQTAPVISYPSPQSYVAGSLIAPLTVTNSGGAATISGQTSTLAGSGTAGFTNGTGTGATFNAPSGVLVTSGGVIYISEIGNDVIRKVTTAGVVTTFAGSGTAGAVNATGTAATFNNPMGMAMDASGNIYVADYSNNLIRKITSAGVVTTFAGSGTAGTTNGTGTAASFNEPCGMAIDHSGNLYVADYGSSLIRMITPAGVVTTFAGSGSAGAANGTGTAASFNNPSALTMDASGNLYVADFSNNLIRKITTAGVVTTFAGNGTAGKANGTSSAAEFYKPGGIAKDALGNIYVTESGNNDVRMVTPTGTVSTLSGTGTASSTDGAGSVATFNNPYGINADQYGNLYVAESGGNKVREVVTTDFSVSPALPAGLSLNGQTGTITGTPTTTQGLTNYTVTATNSYGSGTATVTIEIDPGGAINPSPDNNYVIAFTPRIAGLITSTGLDSASTNKSNLEAAVQYFDGLGRPIQTVQAKGSPTGHDIVTPVVYDQYGRELTKYEPYTITGTYANDGSYKPTAVTDQGTYYANPPSAITKDPFPYSVTLPEASDISRTLEQGAPGDNWQLTGNPSATSPGHTVKMVYTGNNSITWAADSVHSMQVPMYNITINSNESRTIVPNGYYAPGTIDVTVAKDENWVSGRAGTVETYTDNEGHVVLKRQYNYTTTLQVLSTYYIYDNMGDLAYVIPPSAGGDADAAISATTLNNLCYQYRYDSRNRLCQKKLPGKGWEFTVYNILDQPVATQDSLQRLANNWIITKYDALGRTVLTGIWNNNNTAVSQTALQITLSAITTNLWETGTTTGSGYTNVAWPTTYVTTTLGLSYYDGYTNIPGLLATYHLTSGVSLMTQGQLTAKKTAVLNTPTDMLWDVVYYDDLGRTITTYNQHYLGGTANTNNYDLTKTTYDFVNEPTTVTRQHFTTASTTTPLVTIANQYIYDHMGRKLKSWEQITNGSSTPTPRTLLSQLTYSEIGQVANKQLHSTDSVNFFQAVAYTYNERGWLLTSSAPLFAMQLYYNTNSAAKAWNGNIMYQYWGTPGAVTNHYNYTYDKLNRLTSGLCNAGNNENGITYDIEGNITALLRYQTSTLIDNLTYIYNNTNQLQSITDATTNDAGLKHGTWTYAYDGNGNLISDPSKGITLAYNMLNLPQTVTGSKTITYTYDASGQKLRRVSPATGNTDYINGIEYDGTGSNASTISFIQTEEGKAVPNGSGGFDYTYYLGDNLGNTRITFDTQTGSATSLQADNYYPFGMEINFTTTSPKNEYLYNKKELQEELTEYDYGARFYDPVLGRWDVIDPHAENSRRWSTYNYVEDDPIRLTDPDGMDPDRNCQSCGDHDWNKSRQDKEKNDEASAEYRKRITKEEVKQVYHAIQKFAVEHKQILLKTAKGLKYAGDHTAQVGEVAAISGLAFDGVGAAPGATVAVYGKAISGVGSLLEIGTNLITKDYKSAKTSAAIQGGFYIFGAVGNAAMDEFFPGAPDVSTGIKSAAQQTIDLFNNTVQSQTEKSLDKVKGN